ncbi:unnamed protein product [Anisakis simplex]|uniref:Uncharacterized protein n=1 Tax=Anisakis simplex TaxID=6269 RepID=A0A3P6SU79_ANISI|nr:unnamed protein product [Anisakis simplex]
MKSRSRRLSNKKNCAQFPKDDLDGHNERETRISRSISGSSNVDIIDGVSGALPSVISGTHSFSMDNDDMLRRATRSPLSQQIQLWKNELSGGMFPLIVMPLGI